MGCIFYLFVAPVVLVLGGLGTFVAGQMMRGSKRSWAALGGAMVGALAGTLAAALLDLLIFGLFRDDAMLVASAIYLGLVASGATIGYQWLGKGSQA